jgi:ABC-type branched-subunit amino acid transport system ATPase component
VELARALVAEPDLLLLDEPTAGMSEGERDEIAELLTQVQRRGKSLLVVEHNLRFINNICDWVYVMHLGSCIANGPAAVVSVDDQVVAAYVGGSAV